jgi:hypothetical protein
MRILSYISGTLLYLTLNIAVAQEHLSPKNGSLGIPGPFIGSFEIKWASVEGAISYEYVLSDNPLCFAGCPGDTRQEIVPDTSAFEFNLQEDKWYYWITRIIFSNNTFSPWVGISSFFAKTPEGKGELVQINPNPVTDGQINLSVDWALNPGANQFQVYLLNSLGVIIRNKIFAKSQGIRNEDFTIDVTKLSPGIWTIIINVDDNPNNPNNRLTQKVVIGL